MCSKLEKQSFCHQPLILLKTSFSYCYRIVPAHTLTVMCPATTRAKGKLVSVPASLQQE